MYNNRKPVASMTDVVTELNTKPSPKMAVFSSRGPNWLDPSILKVDRQKKYLNHRFISAFICSMIYVTILIWLASHSYIFNKYLSVYITQPDIIAPGVNVIAAFPESIGPSLHAGDKRKTPFNALFGTSMATPHVAGIAGLLKSVHPDFSPAAIRSAIMTTGTCYYYTYPYRLLLTVRTKLINFFKLISATKTDNTGKNPILDFNGNKATPFDYGAGHLNPDSAADPGLVYDMGFEDYLSYLCSRGYNQSMLDKLTDEKRHTCSNSNSFNMAEFNYPSIFVSNLSQSVTITRRVKNVGTPISSYQVNVQEMQGVSVYVRPTNLNFEKYNEEKTFEITFTPNPNANNNAKTPVYGELTWSDGHHQVRSPIVVMLS